MIKSLARFFNSRSQASKDPFATGTLYPCIEKYAHITESEADLAPIANTIKYKADWDIYFAQSAITHFRRKAQVLDISEFRFHHDDYPCLLRTQSEWQLLVGQVENRVQLFSGVDQKIRWADVSDLKGLIIKPTRIENDDLLLEKSGTKWFANLYPRFKKMFLVILGLNGIYSIISILSPIIVIIFLGQTMHANSMTEILPLIVGQGIFLFAYLAFQALRNFAQILIGFRLEYLVSSQLIRRVLLMPISFTETTPLNAQLAGLATFENIRRFLVGSAALSFLEIPFLILLVLALYAIGGPIALVPIGVAFILFVSSYVIRFASNHLTPPSQIKKEKQDFIMELFNNLRPIRQAGLANVWKQRFVKMEKQKSTNALKLSSIDTFSNSYAHFMIMNAGIFTIVLGVHQVIAGEMITPALVASVMLVWRILGPVKTAFLSVSTVEQVKRSLGQIERVMNINTEKSTQDDQLEAFRLKGEVEFSRVAVKYDQFSQPALLGINFRVAKGQNMVIYGQGGSGKKTVFKLILGLYYPQSGRVLIDNLNIRQINQGQLRKQIAYVPEAARFLNGTILENFKYLAPRASTDELHASLDKFGLMDELKQLPKGLKTHLTDRKNEISGSLLKRLMIAAIQLRKPKIWLFDNPGYGLDFQEEEQLVSFIDQLRGSATTIVATSSKAYFDISDHVVWLEDGTIRSSGKPKDVWNELILAMGKSA